MPKQKEQNKTTGRASHKKSAEYLRRGSRKKGQKRADSDYYGLFG